MKNANRMLNRHGFKSLVVFDRPSNTGNATPESMLVTVIYREVEYQGAPAIEAALAIKVAGDEHKARIGKIIAYKNHLKGFGITLHSMSEKEIHADYIKTTLAHATYTALAAVSHKALGLHLTKDELERVKNLLARNFINETLKG